MGGRSAISQFMSLIRNLSVMLFCSFYYLTISRWWLFPFKVFCCTLLPRFHFQICLLKMRWPLLRVGLDSNDQCHATENTFVLFRRIQSSPKQRKEWFGKPPSSKVVEQQIKCPFPRFYFAVVPSCHSVKHFVTSPFDKSASFKINLNPGKILKRGEANTDHP